MLDFIKKNKGKISQILVYLTDCFSRTGGSAIKLSEDLRQKYGVTIYAVAQPTDTRDESGAFNQNFFSASMIIGSEEKGQWMA